MKYIAVFEVPDNEDVSEGAILMCGTKAYGANVKIAPDHCADYPYDSDRQRKERLAMAVYINRDEIKWYGCDFEGGTTCVKHNGPCSTCTHGTVSHDEVMEMESVEIPTWNPVSARLYSDECTFMWDCAVPEEGQTVLITTRFGTVAGVEFTDGCFGNYEDIGDVLAWMPLPAPYKGGTKC